MDIRHTFKTHSFFPVVFLLVVSGFAFVALRQVPKHEIQAPPKTTTTLRVSTVDEYSALIILAKERGFFEDAGLNVLTVEYDSGAPSLQALLDGEVDIATASNFVGVRASFEHSNFAILASMFDSSKVFQLVARKDHGIETPQDLKGKKIGLTKNTMGEFFLGEFLTFQGLSWSDIEAVPGTTPELSAMLAQGEADAITSFPPPIYETIRQMGTTVRVFETQGDHLLYTLAYVRKDYAAAYPDVLKKFIEALLRAQRFMKEQPGETRAFFRHTFNYTDEYIATVISNFNFRLSLNQSMILAMEDEARWAIENGLTDKTLVPNYLQYVEFGPLEAVDPGAVSIIH